MAAVARFRIALARFAGQRDARDRIAEISEILALGLIRMHGRMSSPKSADCGEISLDILGRRSGLQRDNAEEN
jgi:hypothetical protein